MLSTMGGEDVHAISFAGVLDDGVHGHSHLPSAPSKLYDPGPWVWTPLLKVLFNFSPHPCKDVVPAVITPRWKCATRRGCPKLIKVEVVVEDAAVFQRLYKLIHVPKVSIRADPLHQADQLQRE